jgi:uncharacterized membrane protein
MKLLHHIRKIFNRISYDTKFGALVASLMILAGLIMMAVVWVYHHGGF